ncbi:hypothetical protein EAI_02461 [Harpegnathos saltator]|uniref:Uncharacterized protein n=1 Tax=Harpegnathos saltator TaxID=610380 RepID=E2B7F3_HARSA|nr:hypothetical protein EAI_02461 [Harpegnathos saltator]
MSHIPVSDVTRSSPAAPVRWRYVTYDVAELNSFVGHILTKLFCCYNKILATIHVQQYTFPSPFNKTKSNLGTDESRPMIELKFAETCQMFAKEFQKLPVKFAVIEAPAGSKAINTESQFRQEIGETSVLFNLNWVELGFAVS